MAGLGVVEHKDGFAGRCAYFLAEEFGKSVEWEVVAKAGYTAKKTRERLLPKLPEKAPDYLLIGLAANDVFGLNSPNTWAKSMEDLLIELFSKYPDTKMILLNLPPVETFPAFTKLIRSIFGNLMNLYHPVNQRLARNFDKLTYAEKRIRLEEWRKLIPTIQSKAPMSL